jgi:hypothetical protein
MCITFSNIEKIQLIEKLGYNTCMSPFMCGGFPEEIFGQSGKTYVW